jgi:hypothetical protein
MRSISSRVQWWLIAIGYAAVIAFGATASYRRYLWELENPVEAMGGMAAGGDLIMGIFLALLLMIPTFFVVRLIAKAETSCNKYARFLVGLSLSAPVCMAVVFFSLNHVPDVIGYACIWRVFLSPLVLCGMGVSWWMVRTFRDARRWTAYSLLIETLTILAAIVVLVRS